jgi:hypothetical protein
VNGAMGVWMIWESMGTGRRLEREKSETSRRSNSERVTQVFDWVRYEARVRLVCESECRMGGERNNDVEMRAGEIDRKRRMERGDWGWWRGLGVVEEEERRSGGVVAEVVVHSWYRKAEDYDGGVGGKGCCEAPESPHRALAASINLVRKVAKRTAPALSRDAMARAKAGHPHCRH